MATKFRKSFKVAPGVKININKNSVSISGGVKGARKTISSTGRTTTTVDIPGTGIYSTSSKKIGGSSSGSYSGYSDYEDTESAPKVSFFDIWEDNPRDCNKVVYILLAFFLGMFGVHKFYQGKTKTGMKYLVFFWTAVPWLFAILEGTFYTCQILIGLVVIGIKKVINRKANDDIENL